MTIKDKIIHAMQGMENQELSTQEIVEKVLHDFPEVNKKSIRQADYCYNYKNDDSKVEQFFLRIKRGVFEYVGENYDYDGPIEYANNKNRVQSSNSNIPDGITHEEILKAARAYDDKSVLHEFSHSTTYDVIINGLRYPPKAIIGIASSYHLDKLLTPHHFSGGLQTKCFRVLKENGFQIVLKNDDIVYPNEVSQTTVHTEGSVIEVIINRYERDTGARDKCIEHYGLQCKVCDFNFEDTYGDLGAGFIHVHHLVPISDIKEEYKIDPIKDLRPVCPNCHAMLHKRKKPYSIDELKAILNKVKK